MATRTVTKTTTETTSYPQMERSDREVLWGQLNLQRLELIRIMRGLKPETDDLISPDGPSKYTAKDLVEATVAAKDLVEATVAAKDLMEATVAAFVKGMTSKDDTGDKKPAVYNVLVSVDPDLEPEQVKSAIRSALGPETGVEIK